MTPVQLAQRAVQQVAMRSLLTIETPVEKSKLRSILHYSGLSISSQVIVDGVMAELGEGRRPSVTVVRK